MSAEPFLVTDAGLVLATCRVLVVASCGTVTVTWWPAQFSAELTVRLTPAESSKYEYDVLPAG